MKTAIIITLCSVLILSTRIQETLRISSRIHSTWR